MPIGAESRKSQNSLMSCETFSLSCPSRLASRRSSLVETDVLKPMYSLYAILLYNFGITKPFDSMVITPLFQVIT